jgi:hypothetical protein
MAEAHVRRRAAIVRTPRLPASVGEIQTVRLIKTLIVVETVTSMP